MQRKIATIYKNLLHLANVLKILILGKRKFITFSLVLKASKDIVGRSGQTRQNFHFKLIKFYRQSIIDK